MKLIRSFSFAWNGLKICFASESNFKIHTTAAVVAILLGIALSIPLAEWLILLFCFGLVAGMEMMNTAVEKLCNEIHPGIHPGIKTIKDIAAGAVMIAAGCSLITGLLIFLPRIFMYVKTI